MESLTDLSSIHSLWGRILSDTTSRYLHPSHHTLRHTATTVLQDISSNIFPDIFSKPNSGSNISQISYKYLKISHTTSRYLHWFHHTLCHTATTLLQDIFQMFLLTHFGLENLTTYLTRIFEAYLLIQISIRLPTLLVKLPPGFCKIFC